ncbi:GGDEF domain-containing protein [Ideonella sp. BN130291]|uniref:GGDEF domain-containing protein n=1 Tax=Ideonella sp. BN130291 TaxID=3112940 RepID=UPI002E2762C9|nr:GGDEF domain-containing protein [Ideonella sp. BN130291]
MTSLTVVNTLLQALILGLYAWSGAVSWPVMVAFSAVSLGSSLIFTLAVALHWNLRVPDAWLLYAQLGANVLISLAFLSIAPQLAVVFLASLLVTFNFAMMSFTPRQFFWSWVAFGVCTAVALWLGRARFASVAPSDFNMAVLWLFFVLAVRRLATIGSQFSKLRAQLSEKNLQLTQSLERINELATHDELTGAFNRRRFMQMLVEERERAHRTRQVFSVAIFDLDHFKTVNDRFGHAAGDAVLKAFCALVQASLRSTDRFARYGGEEFVMLMPSTTPAEAAAVAVERIRAAAEGKDWSAILPGHAVTLSAGVATFRSDESIEELLARADAALYAAKHNGRNRFELAP